MDKSAYVKAGFLAAIAKQETQCDLITPVYATELLGTMMGGYNIQPLIELLDYDATAEAAEKALSKIVMVYDAYHDVVEKAEANQYAKRILQSWAEAEWFLSRPALAEAITLTVLKVPGETNTDDLSPATEAWSRPDIPLHAKAMLVSKMPDALDTIISLKKRATLLLMWVMLSVPDLHVNLRSILCSGIWDMMWLTSRTNVRAALF